MESNEVQSEFEQVKAELKALELQNAPLIEEQQKLRDAEKLAAEEYKFKIAKLRNKAADIDNKLYQDRAKVNDLKRKAEALERELQRQENERKVLEIEAQREKERDLLFTDLDKFILKAQWGELAKAHQVDGGKYITENRNVILADPMGLGKTLTAIVATDMIEYLSHNASPEFPLLGETARQYDGSLVIKNAITTPVGKRIIYVCPSSLMRNVRKEFSLWAEHRNVTFLGGMTKKERDFIFEHVLKNFDEYVVIINYEAWRKDLNLIERLVGLGPDTIILDEAHNVKDTNSIAYRGVASLILDSKPAYVIPMTGTPILNRPQELFSLLSLVNPREFYNLNDFLYKFCEQDDDKFWRFKPGGLDRIARQIRKNFLRRTRDQAGIELPEKTITLHELEVDSEKYPEQHRVREQMRKHAAIMVNEERGQAVIAGAMIAMFTRLRQIETWPAGIVAKDPITKEILFEVDVKESQKVDYVISSAPDEQGNFTGLIPELIEDERIVLFSQFKAPLREIALRVINAGYRAVVLDGETSTKEREEISNDYNARYTSDRTQSKWDVVLCNYKVGGIGLNLTAATQMVILDEEWNPGKRDQAYDRIHRMGQEKPVTIHVIRNQNTIDDWLAGIMEAKEGLVEGFNNATTIDPDDFREFLNG